MLSASMMFSKKHALASTAPLAVLLVLASFSNSSLAQSDSEITPDEANRARSAITCVDRNIPLYDDKISSAEIVAKSVLDACESLARGSFNPNAPDLIARSRRQRAMLEALSKETIARVLKNRVRNSGR